MKKRKFNKYLAIANCFAFIPLGAGRFIQIPDFIDGVSMGACIAFFLIGLYSLNHDIDKLKNFKKNFTCNTMR